MFPRSNLYSKLKCVVIVLLFIFLIDYFGILTHMFELDYYRLFNYPLDGDILQYSHRVRFHQEVEVKPINFYNYTFLEKCHQKCVEDGGSPISPKITFIVKSAMPNFERRQAIRQTWGYETRFSDVIIRTVFMLGVSNNQELQKHIKTESLQYNDIVQSNFEDTYFNNTIKTMMGFRWAVEVCPTSKFYLFVDDDYYVSPKNALRFVENPESYPRNIDEADETLRKLGNRFKNRLYFNKFPEAMAQQGLTDRRILAHLHSNFYEDSESPAVNANPEEEYKKQSALLSDGHNDKLFAGFVFKSSPHRHKSSKWYVSLAEYPFHMWPPYVTAGAFILSREALFEMYFASMYVQHFRFDDVYLGLVALKAKIELHHCEEFYFHRPTYSGPYSYRYVVATHGFEDSKELIKTWTECRSAGHA
ncbi:beta-1,3-galactosyltransferase brn [Episyrphus balteatus]|uniref:beta-1,3-galactosyltransferase brn n=1 Tax=Episyrphus balteatus TaxID=286459 RepID=UPI0024853098|nr:beta-1,3-galactosyltransferase brn [Episyrphus balteatus]